MSTKISLIFSEDFRQTKGCAGYKIIGCRVSAIHVFDLLPVPAMLADKNNRLKLVVGQDYFLFTGRALEVMCIVARGSHS
jgi:hypothetical protein